MSDKTAEFHSDLECLNDIIKRQEDSEKQKRQDICCSSEKESTTDEKEVNEISALENMLKQGFLEAEHQEIPAVSNTDQLTNGLQSCSFETRDADEANSRATLCRNISQPMKISDEDIVELSIRDFNNLLNGFSKETKDEFRRRRRLLKNRTYAQRCRDKKVEEEQAYFEENKLLKDQLSSLQRETAICQNKYNAMLSALREVKNRQKKRKLDMEPLREKTKHVGLSGRPKEQ